MRGWQAGVAAVVWWATAAGAEEPSLPAWNEAERAAEFVDGALFAADSEPGAGERLGLAPPPAEDNTAAENPAPGIPEKFWAAYFAERPRKFLIDPQGVLSANDARERLGFLNYHAGDSAIDLFVYVFQGDQEIPGEVRAEELAERFFASGRPAAIVWYFQGAPQRAALHLSPTLTDLVVPAEQRRALESSIMQAVAKENPSAQLEAFLVQMSIRIYWMEQLWRGGKSAGTTTPAEEKPPKKPDAKSALLAKLQPLLEKARRFVLPAAGAAGALAIAGLIAAGLRMRARYRLPVLEVEPRLGGDHAAGAGAVISFASANLALASQREQRPDDPRRA